MPVRLNPRKLHHSKWTAVQPRNKEKHFIVTQVIEPEPPESPVLEVEIEAVYSGRSEVIAWKSLTDAARWKQGWH